jgi:FAD:protein FMN transferase
VNAPHPPVSHRHHQEEVMGTVVTFDAYFSGRSSANAGNRLKRAVGDLHRVDQVFSTWRADSPLSQLRRGARDLGDVPPEIRDVLSACHSARRASGGWFDPWRMPGGVDPTGYVKGWAAQRALKKFAGPEMLGAVVNAAGDVATIGVPAPGQAFRIGVVDPAAPRQLATVVESPGAVVTSGTYEGGSHLIDPHSGVAGTRVASATVCGADLGLCDALATGLCVGGDEAMASVERLPGFEALLIRFDGTWRWTESFPFAPDFAPSLSSRSRADQLATGPC